jgi:hypothetical protein
VSILINFQAHVCLETDFPAHRRASIFWVPPVFYLKIMRRTVQLMFENLIFDSSVPPDSKMQNLESAAANYAAQQQAMGFPNMGTEDPYAGQQVLMRQALIPKEIES